MATRAGRRAVHLGWLGAELAGEALRVVTRPRLLWAYAPSGRALRAVVA